MNGVIYKSDYKFDLTIDDINTLKKSNFFIDDIVHLEVSEYVSTDWQIITTVFLIVDYFNNKKYDYDANTVFSINIHDLNKLWNVRDRTDTGYLYRSIKESCSKLRANKYRYPDIEKGGLAESGLFQYISMNEAVISFGFPLTLIPYLKNFSKYTWLWFESLKNLSKKPNASILFEYVCSKRYIGNKNGAGEILCTISIDNFRKLFSDKTSSKADLIRRKIIPSIEYVNEKTNLNITYKQNLNLQSIESYTLITEFSGLDSSLDKVNDPEMNAKPFFSQRQVMKFLPKLMELESFVLSFKAKDVKNKETDLLFAQRISVEMLDNKKLYEFYPFLVEVGYSNKRIEKAIEKKRLANKIGLEQKEKIKQNKIKEAIELGLKNADKKLSNEDQLPF